MADEVPDYYDRIGFRARRPDPRMPPEYGDNQHADATAWAGVINDKGGSGIGAARRGDWMQTVTGRQFWPMDPRANEVAIEDIAHALAMQRRFAGHCLRFYSVAEHSFHLSHLVAPENALWALLHDASEAYLVDVPRPVKFFLAGYRPAEDAVMAAVCEHFALPAEMPAEVKIADGRILADEAAQNMSKPPAPWTNTGPAFGIELRFWQPEVARSFFLARFDQLRAEARHG